LGAERNENISNDSIFHPLDIHKLWKKDRENTRLQTPWALPDFCTEYGVNGGLFFLGYDKKIRYLYSCWTTQTPEDHPFSRLKDLKTPLHYTITSYVVL